MRFVDPPTLDFPLRGHSEDDIEGLLREFYRAEMPHPWPAVTVPDEAPARGPRLMPARRSLFRSRLALAASVALLVVGLGLLSGSFTQLTNGSAPSIDEGSASRIGAEIEVLPTGTSRIRINVSEMREKEKPAEKKIVDDANELLPKP